MGLPELFAHQQKIKSIPHTLTDTPDQSHLFFTDSVEQSNLPPQTIVCPIPLLADTLEQSNQLPQKPLQSPTHLCRHFWPILSAPTETLTSPAHSHIPYVTCSCSCFCFYPPVIFSSKQMNTVSILSCLTVYEVDVKAWRWSYSGSLFPKLRLFYLFNWNLLQYVILMGSFFYILMQLTFGAVQSLLICFWFMEVNALLITFIYLDQYWNTKRLGVVPSVLE